MVTRDYVSYKTAKLLKEKNRGCFLRTNQLDINELFVNLKSINL